MKKRLVILIGLLFFAAARICLAHGGESSGPMPRPSAETATRILSAKLEEVHMQPSLKPSLLSLLREKATRLGGADRIDERMSAISKIVDDAIGMRDDTLSQQREKMAREIWHQMTGE
jgi:hypothetical protein